MNGRSEREKRFFDSSYEMGRRASLSKFYATARSSRDYYERLLADGCPGTILEYGCGQGSYAFLLAKWQAKVVGIDISRPAVEQARARAKDQELEITFSLMNAESTGLAADAFDLVCGTGILHHLSLDAAAEEIARVLKPGATAVFIEPLGHNPLINLYRQRTPQYRTEDEHPLMRKDLSTLGQGFRRCDCRFFHLFSLLGVLFRNTSRFERLLTGLDALDTKLFDCVPALKWLAWQVVILLEGPRGQ